MKAMNIVINLISRRDETHPLRSIHFPSQFCQFYENIRKVTNVSLPAAAFSPAPLSAQSNRSRIRSGLWYCRKGCASKPWLKPPKSRAVDLGDLHVYDPVAMAWTNLSAAASGTPPVPRYWHGFTTVGGRLYVHGGLGDDGDFFFFFFFLGGGGGE